MLFIPVLYSKEVERFVQLQTVSLTMLRPIFLIVLFATPKLVESLVMPMALRTPWQQNPKRFNRLQPRYSVAKTPEIQTEAWQQEEEAECMAVVCGGGPAGLLSAIMLAQKFPNVRSTASTFSHKLAVCHCVLISSPDYGYCTSI